MGNCGVGFAPVRPGTEDELVSLMESVEDIPGTALHDGIPWGWETFPEYLAAIDTPYTVDVGAQVPHVAIRHYVMGERCYDGATEQDMAEMRTITREALTLSGPKTIASSSSSPGERSVTDARLGIGPPLAASKSRTSPPVSATSCPSARSTASP